MYEGTQSVSQSGNLVLATFRHRPRDSEVGAVLSESLLVSCAMASHLEATIREIAGGSSLIRPFSARAFRSRGDVPALAALPSTATT